MGKYLDQSGVTALWNKAKATFGASLEASGTTLTLRSGAATPTALSQVAIPAATADSPGAMSAADKAKLDGVAAGATANEGTITSVKVGSAAAVTSGAVSIPSASSSAEGVVRLGTTSSTAAAGDHGHSSYAPKASPELTGTPTAPTAAAGTSTAQVATCAFVQSAVASAVTGAAVYKGVLAKPADLSGLASYKTGWYWVVSASGAYAGKACEPGDMVFCNSDKGSAFSSADFDVVQANIQAMTAAEVEAVCV